MPINARTLEEIALTLAENELICQWPGREPTSVEFAMFGGLWSEHCAYKHSKPFFGYFPTRSRRARIPLGEENAGVDRIGCGDYSDVLRAAADTAWRTALERLLGSPFAARCRPA